MRINTRWLRELVPVDTAPEELSRTLTALGLEVERQTDLAVALRDIVFGEIAEKRPHPNASGMFVCQVNLGDQGQRQIVCASEHPIEIGWRVPVAPAGMVLPTGVPIRAGKFRGVTSEGMICLDRELGLMPEGSGLSHRGSDVRPGTSLIEARDVSEALIDLAILPNRPDCMGLVGIARELAAAHGVKWVRPGAGDGPADPTSSCPVPIEIEDRDACPRYVARVLRGVRVKKSPMWLSSRLVIAGFRPVNNVVDVTNLVLFEYGQPLHAFDLARLAGPRITVRRAAPGEPLVLLDDTVLELDSEALVIADAQRPLALAGIMGGRDSGVESSTTDVLLESASFDPVRIRRTARRYGLRTESSVRFERGADPNDGVAWASRRAAQLIASLCPGSRPDGMTDQYPRRIAPRHVPLDAALVNRTLGTSDLEAPVDDARIDDILRRLGMTRDAGVVEVPTWRADVTDPVVLIEDIARHVGYDTVPMRAPSWYTPRRSAAGIVPARRIVRGGLLQSGLWETRSLPLEHRARLRPFCPSGHPPTLRNPIGVELGTLRDSHLPRLLDVVQHNERRNRGPLRFFEIDRLFDEAARPQERWVATGVVAGASLDGYWRGAPPTADFYWLKGVVENLAEALGFAPDAWRCHEGGPAFLDAEESATLVCDGVEIGRLGRLTAAACAPWDLRATLQVFELELDRITELRAALPAARHRGVPPYPAVLRDLSFFLPDGVTSAQIIDGIREIGGAWVESVECYDAWTDEAPGNRRSLAFAVVYRAADRTLTAEEIADLEQRMVERMTGELSVTLRGELSSEGST